MERVAVGMHGEAADGASSAPSASADGRYIAFTSDAGNLVPDDDNDVTDVFVRDMLAGTTELVSTTGAASGNFRSEGPHISADGRRVAFSSFATDLTAASVGAGGEVFLRDRATGTTRQVSDGANGKEYRTLALGADGRFVAYWDAAVNYVVFIFEAETDRTQQITGGSSSFRTPHPVHDLSLSRSSARAVYASAGGVYVRDLEGGTTTEVVPALEADRQNLGTRHASISADGRLVAFASAAGDLVDGDRNGLSDVFVRDLDDGVATRVSVSSSGGDADGRSSAPVLSGDGRSLVFASEASDLTSDGGSDGPALFLHDLATSTSRRIAAGEPEGYLGLPLGLAIAADGDVAAVLLHAASGPPELAVHDAETHGTETVTVALPGDDADGSSSRAVVSGDGRFVAFASDASDLVAGDRNGMSDVFVRDLATGTVRRVSVDGAGADADAPSSQPAISADGRYVAFSSWASDLVEGDANERRTSSYTTLTRGERRASRSTWLAGMPTNRAPTPRSTTGVITSPSPRRRTISPPATPTARTTSSSPTCLRGACCARRWTRVDGRRTAPATSRPSRAMAARWPSPPTPRISPPATETRRPTCCCATCEAPPPPSSRSRLPEPRATVRAVSPRRAPTAAPSPSCPVPPISLPERRVEVGRCTSATSPAPRPPSPPGKRSVGSRSGTAARPRSVPTAAVLRCWHGPSTPRGQ